MYTYHIWSFIILPKHYFIISVLLHPPKWQKKSYFRQKRWEGKNVLVWHHPSQEPFVDLFRFLSMQSCDFSIWSLDCTIVDNLIHCLGSKQKILTTRMKKNWNSVSVTFKLDIILKSKYWKVCEAKLESCVLQLNITDFKWKNKNPLSARFLHRTWINRFLEGK